METKLVYQIVRHDDFFMFQDCIQHVKLQSKLFVPKITRQYF